MNQEQAEASGEAWREFCDRLKASGDRLEDEGFLRGDSDLAEGYRHLRRLLILSLVELVEFADPAFPALYRHNDDVMRWGGPSVDNTYWRAPISAERTYRVNGWLPPGALFVVQSAHGEMHQGTMGIADRFGLRRVRRGRRHGNSAQQNSENGGNSKEPPGSPPLVGCRHLGGPPSGRT